MSAVKTFALGVLMTGALTSATLAGSMQGVPSLVAQPKAPAPTPLASTRTAPAAPGTRIIAAANLAGNWTGFGPAGGSVNLGSITSAGTTNGSGLVLGTSQPSSPINFGGASFRIAASVPGATAGSSQPAPAAILPPPPPVPADSHSFSHSYSRPAPPDVRRADAFVNFGNGLFPDASTLTTGNPQSYLKSPVIANLFGSNGPTPQDVDHFENQVVATVQKTYNSAGLPINLTRDPNVPAAHTLSVVSGAYNPENPGAIGIAEVGNNGYTFIDKLGGVNDRSKLATAIGHNVAHELMHAFGLADHPETNGPYVDAATTTLSNLTDPNGTFSPSAAALLSTLDFQATGHSVAGGIGSQGIEGDQTLVPEATPVPEPTTIALWALAGCLTVAYRRRRSA